MRRTLPFISIGLNVVLAVWVMVLLRARHGAPSSEPFLKTSGPAMPAVPLPSRVGLRSASAEVPPQARFDWRQVESEDYKQYLANLRAIGCPEKTVRDIIVADVNDLFASKVAAVTRTNQYQYWRKEPVSRSEEQTKQLRDLYAQKREVMKTLGVDVPDFTDLLGEAFRDKMEEHELELAFLPESKRREVKETLFGQAQQEIAEGNDVSRHDAMEEEAQVRIRSLLTPEEYKEYELRCSMDALQLRGVLDGAVLTEQEFRAIFGSWRSLKAFSPGTAEYREAQQSSETTIQQLLGPDRFQLYLGGVKLLGYAK